MTPAFRFLSLHEFTIGASSRVLIRATAGTARRKPARRGSAGRWRSNRTTAAPGSWSLDRSGLLVREHGGSHTRVIGANQQVDLHQREEEVVQRTETVGAGQHLADASSFARRSLRTAAVWFRDATV
jgi:hypothetical protein